MRIFLFLFSLFLYILTLAPDIYWGDNSEAVINFYFSGKYFTDLPFFSSYFGKIFTFLPVGNIPFRVNIFSAFLSPISVIIFYDILLYFLEDKGNNKISKASAFLGSMFFLTSYTLWRFAVIGEVVSFIFFCYLSLLYLILKIGQQDIRILYFISFVLAFFVNFFTVVDFYFQFFIVLFLYVFISCLNFKESYTKKITVTFLFYIFGTLFFSVIYLFRKMNYDILMFFNYYLKLASGSFELSLLNILKYFISLIYYLDRQISLHMGVFSILGLFYIYKFKKGQLKLLFLLFFCPFIFMCLKTSREDIFSYEHHFFSVYLLLFIFFTGTLYFILNQLNFKICFVISSLIFLIHFVFNFQLNNKSNLKFARTEILHLFDNVEPNAVIIVQNSEFKKLVNYFQIIEGKRKDVTVVGTSDFSNPVFLELIEKRKKFYDDTIPCLNFEDTSRKIDRFIKYARVEPLYFLISKEGANLEEKILYNKLLNYDRKFITTIVQFKGEKIPSPFTCNLIKIEK